MRRLVASLAGLLLCGCPSPPPTATSGEPDAIAAADPPLFRLADNGPNFVHHNGRGGAFYMPELYGAGAALFDYDNDGDLDVYLVQGQHLGAGTSPDPARPSLPQRSRHLRESLASTDVTDESGLAATGASPRTTRTFWGVSTATSSTSPSRSSAGSSPTSS